MMTDKVPASNLSPEFLLKQPKRYLGKKDQYKNEFDIEQTSEGMGWGKEWKHGLGYHMLVAHQYQKWKENGNNLKAWFLLGVPYYMVLSIVFKVSVLFVVNKNNYINI